MQPAVTTGLDIAKSVFQIYGVDAMVMSSSGSVCSRRAGLSILCQDPGMPHRIGSLWSGALRGLSRHAGLAIGDDQRADRGNGSASADQRTRRPRSAGASWKCRAWGQCWQARSSQRFLKPRSFKSGRNLAAGSVFFCVPAKLQRRQGTTRRHHCRSNSRTAFHINVVAGSGFAIGLLQ